MSGLCHCLVLRRYWWWPRLLQWRVLSSSVADSHICVHLGRVVARHLEELLLPSPFTSLHLDNDRNANLHATLPGPVINALIGWARQGDTRSGKCDWSRALGETLSRPPMGQTVEGVEGNKDMELITQQCAGGGGGGGVCSAAAAGLQWESMSLEGPLSAPLVSHKMPSVPWAVAGEPPQPSPLAYRDNQEERERERRERGRTRGRVSPHLSSREAA